MSAAEVERVQEVEAAVVLQFGHMRMPLKSHARLIAEGETVAILWRAHARGKLVKAMVSATSDVMVKSLKVGDTELLTKPKQANMLKLDKFSTVAAPGCTIRLELERRAPKPAPARAKAKRKRCSSST